MIAFLTNGLQVLGGSLSAWFHVGRGMTQLPLGYSSALVGAGYLIGITSGLAMLIGIAIAWAGFVPYFTITGALPDGMTLQKFAGTVYQQKVRLIGAGAMGVAAIWTLLCLARPVIDGVKESIAGARADSAERGLHRMDIDMTMKSVGLVFAVTVIGLLVPALRSDTVPGTRLDVLAHTPLAQARLSGRVADVVQAYGDQIVGRLESNRAFYAQVDANLAAAWQASQEVGGVVDVTAASGAVDTAAVREQADAVAARTGAATASPSPAPGASPGATTSPGAPTGPGASSSAAPGASPGATPQESATPALPTGAQAVAEYGRTTAVLTTDLHCNLDVIALAGRLDELSGARLHLDDGDLTMTGSSPEQVCVDALTDAIPSGVERVATIGNHDSEATAHQLRARGWTVTDGTVQSAAGLRILGDVDADRSPAGGTYQRGSENSAQIGARLARTSCKAGADVDVVLIHQPYTFGPLVSEGCAPLLLAGHLHQEKGMSVSRGGNTTVTQLISGAGKGGTSIGPVTQDAYLHVLSFDENGALRGWRAVVVHPDASVTVGAWNGVPEPGSAPVGASRDALEATTAPSDD